MLVNSYSRTPCLAGQISRGGSMMIDTNMIDNMKRWRTVFVACLLVSALMSTASAQTFQAQITGVVRDPSGAVIPNARVVATNIATRVAYSTESNGQGIYRDRK